MPTLLVCQKRLVLLEINLASPPRCCTLLLLESLPCKLANFSLARFATYVPFEGPVAVMLKVIGPKPLMTTCAFCWGVVCLGMCMSGFAARSVCHLEITN